MTKINPEYLKNLEKSTKEVEAWPQWKKDIMHTKGRVVVESKYIMYFKREYKNHYPKSWSVKLVQILGHDRCEFSDHKAYFTCTKTELEKVKSELDQWFHIEPLNNHTY